MPSWIWQHFDRNEQGKRAQCKHCPKLLSFSGGNGTLLYHALKCHNITAPPKPQVRVQYRTNSSGGRTGESQPPLESLSNQEQDSVSEISVDLSCRDASGRRVSNSSVKASAANAIATQGQGVITQWVTSSSSRQCSSGRASILTKMVVNCVVKDFQPLSFLEDGALRDMVVFMEPNFQPPCHKTIRAHLLTAFKKRKDELKQYLKGAEVSITADGWTNSQMVGFFSITAHRITDDWKIETITLDSPSIPERHTAAVLAKVLQSVIDEWEVTVFCATHDTAANMNAAMRRTLGVRFDIGCLAHLLQLAINETFKGGHDKLSKVIKKVRDIISFSGKSENFSRELRKFRDQVQPGMAGRELQADVPTRWNSTVIMLKSFNDLQTAVELAVRSICKPDDKKKYSFSTDELELISDAIRILEPLRKTTDQWQGDKYVTISTVYPVAFAIVKSLKSLTGLSRDGRELVVQLVDNIEDRLCLNDQEYLGTMSIHMIASFLDPRFKRLSAVADEVRRSVRRTVQEELDKSPALTSADTDVIVEDENAARTSFLSELLGAVDGGPPQEAMDRSEVDLYAEEKPAAVDSEPLGWWRQRQAIYPRLAVLAKRYLAAQATSAASERLFSAFGNLYDVRRMRLEVDTASGTIFLHGNGMST